MEEAQKKAQRTHEDLKNEIEKLQQKITQLENSSSRAADDDKDNEEDLQLVSEKVKASASEENRGNTSHLPPCQRQNVVLLFGCEPSSGIYKNSKMMHQSKYAIEHRFDSKKLTLQIPQVFEFLEGEDCDFEMVTSSTLQNLELPYRDNIVAESHAVVFQNDSLTRPGLEPLIYSNCAEHSALAAKMLKETLKFDTVELIQNPSKQEVLDKINELKEKSDKFELDHQPQTVILITVVWVGFKLD